MRYKEELNEFLAGLWRIPDSRGDFSIIDKKKFIRKFATDAVFCMCLKMRKFQLKLLDSDENNKISKNVKFYYETPI